jgi:cobalt/nickel transport system permease protein
MIGESFAQGKTLLHQLDPRGKLLAAALISFSLAFSEDVAIVSGGLVIAFGLLLLAKPAGREVVRRLVFANYFLLFFWLFLPLTYGERIWPLGVIPVRIDGLLLALLLTLKANAILLIFMTLVGTSSIVTTGHALHNLGVPAKLVHLLLFTFRYVHVLETEFARLHNAMLIRGFRPRTDLHTYRSYAYLIGMLLVRSSNRAQRVYEAMLCRGFHGRFHSLYHFSFTRKDGMFAFLVLLLVTMMGYLEWFPKN